MKLPGYKEQPAPRAQGVDPGVYRAVGAAQQQAARAIGQVGREMEAHYQRRSVGDYNRAKAGAVALSQQILNEHAQTPYLRADELPPGMAAPENIEQREEEYQSPTGETLTRLVDMVPTHTVSNQLYQQAMEDYNKQVAPNMTKLAQSRYADAYNYEIAPKSHAAIQSRAFEQQRAIETVEWNQQAEIYINTGDEEGLSEHITLGITSGVLTEAEGIQALQNGMEDLAKTDYIKSLDSPDTSLATLTELPDLIREDIRLPPKDIAVLAGQAERRLVDEHLNLVGDAAAERNINGLIQLRSSYATPDKDGKHHTNLDGKTRDRLISKIDSIFSSYQTEGAAQAKEDLHTSRERVKNEIDRVLAAEGGPDDLANLSTELALSDAATTAADVRLKRKYGLLVPHLENIADLPNTHVTTREAYISSLPNDTPEDRYTREMLQQYSENVTKKLSTDATSYARNQGWYADDQAFYSPMMPGDEGVNSEVLASRLNNNALTRTRTGHSSGPLTETEAVSWAAWAETATPEQQLEVSTQLAEFGVVGQTFWKQLGGKGARVIAGAMMTDPSGNAKTKADGLMVAEGQSLRQDDTITVIKNEHDVSSYYKAGLAGVVSEQQKDAAVDAMLSYTTASRYKKGGVNQTIVPSSNFKDALAAVIGPQLKADTKGWNSGGTFTAPNRSITQKQWNTWVQSSQFAPYVDRLGGAHGYDSHALQDLFDSGDVTLHPTPERGVYLLETTVRPGYVTRKDKPDELFKLRYHPEYGAE